MNTQPKTLQLADALQNYSVSCHKDAAAELRRLHEANQELLEALKDLLMDTQHSEHECGDSQWCPVVKARAAIAKHSKEQA